jgi:hypothetical protein
VLQPGSGFKKVRLEAVFFKKAPGEYSGRLFDSEKFFVPYR